MKDTSTRSRIIKRGTAQTVADLRAQRPGIDNTDHPYAFDLKNSVEIIQKAIADGEHITIIGDYDADGICASAIMATALKQLGVNPDVRLPLRFTEGYGMNPVMVDEIESGLVITVDNGIAAHEAISAAKAKGLTVLVTDHHEPVIDGDKIILPEADCVINPHVERLSGQGGYDFHGYCGAGIALKLAERLLEGKPAQIIDRLYPFAMIATVADVMPLVEDNRNIYKRGAKNVQLGNMTTGLAQLFAMNKVNTQDIPAGFAPHQVITADQIGFRIGPCINAASRMSDDGAMLAYRCLTSDGSNREARGIAEQLVNINDKRKTITASERAEIERQIDALKVKCPIVIYLPDSAPGIIGLHAGWIAENYGVPAIVICGHGDKCKGSARSVEGAHMKNLADECAELLEEHGGHEGAAGLTIREENIPAFREKFTEVCIVHGVHPVIHTDIECDLVISEKDVAKTLQELKAMEPFGEGNPQPVICVKDFRPRDVKTMAGKHGKWIGEGIEVIKWGAVEEGMPEIDPDTPVAVVGTLGYNFFRGNASHQMIADYIGDGRTPDHVIEENAFEDPWADPRG